MAKWIMDKMFTALLGLLMVGVVTSAAANILVSPTIINFLPNQLPRQDVVVMNQGDTNAYIEVTPYRVDRPGTANEKKIQIHNPKELGLLVSPNKLIIPPKQHRVLRIIQLSQSLKEDEIYRITVAPIPNKLLPVETKDINDRKMGVRVVLAYGILAIVRPEQMRPQLLVKRQGKNLLIENKGNTNIVIVGGEQCLNDNCFQLPSRRIYAGNRWEVGLPFNQPITVTSDYLGKREKITSN